MNKHRRIFIVGNSGAGKGVLAEELAKKLGWLYVNADFSLAPTIGRRASEVIGKDGEESFNNCLSEILSYQITQD